MRNDRCPSCKTETDVGWGFVEYCPSCGWNSDSGGLPDAPVTDLPQLASDMTSAITLASNSIPMVDRIDRRRLMGLRDRLDRYHSALLAEMKRPEEGPFGTIGCWQTREPQIRDWIRQVNSIVKTAGLVPGEPEHPLSSGPILCAGADHAPAPASRDGFGNLSRRAA